MPRVIVIAEGLVDQRSQQRHQTILSERTSQLSPQHITALEQAIADAAALERNPPAQPIPHELIRRVRAVRQHPPFQTTPPRAV